MPLKVGTRDIVGVKIGSRDVIRIMHGSRLVWEAGGGEGGIPDEATDWRSDTPGTPPADWTPQFVTTNAAYIVADNGPRSDADDYSTHTLGAPPSGWTARYVTTNSTYEVVSDE